MINKIPKHEIGAESKAISKIVFNKVELAKNHFEIVKKRFLDVNSWELFAGKNKAKFTLRNQEGELILNQPKVGNYITIEVPLLPNKDKDHFDWVKIEVYEEEKKEDYEAIYIRVRPTSNPTNDTNETIHFLDSKATSNFFIRRNETEISAEIYAINEVPNFEDKTILEKIRNKAVALGGMLFGSKLQWEGLTDGLIRREK